MGTQAQAVLEERNSACIARQPILTQDETVVGYELFFRQSQEEQRFTSDADGATSVMIDALSVLGFDVLCDGRLAFINCNRQVLLKDELTLLPPGEVVVEIQETVPPDECVVAACQQLKQAGYALALDNFGPGDKREPLVPYADFIKVDVKQVAPDNAAGLVARYASKQCRMLAQKVETRQQQVTAAKNGFTHFQGYFFRHPERLRARQIPANQASNLRLLQAVSKQELDFAEIEDLIKHEPSLCYRLLRYLNSPLLGMSTPVQSVRHAFNLLGERELARWIRMATTLVMGQEKSSDLILASLVRARFCELIAPKVKHGESDLFLMGILSLMDAILEVPIGVVIENLSLNPETSAQLVGGKTGGKTTLSPIYDLMMAREAGDWEAVAKRGKELGLSIIFVNKTYNEAMHWARQITSAIRPQPSPGTSRIVTSP
ncbi:MAG: HDOD domain-containing protein [Acidobacteriia bacterium]|nr:HDOD domain-containing protein [Terriglobia bacterium]